tara:strand:- start:7 stop:120 length:114 start_codon:yes stop_codon:yes gene_type:complete
MASRARLAAVQAIANAVWTDAVKADYKTFAESEDMLG